MAEYIAVERQTVAVGENVLFDEAVIPGCRNIVHRPGSGIFHLRGVNQCRTRYRISFGGNITGATAGTEVALSVSAEGEPILSSQMIYTPATGNAFGNVADTTFVEVPNGVAFTVTVKNTGTTALDVMDANLIIEKVG